MQPKTPLLDMEIVAAALVAEEEEDRIETIVAEEGEGAGDKVVPAIGRAPPVKTIVSQVETLVPGVEHLKAEEDHPEGEVVVEEEVVMILEIAIAVREGIIIMIVGVAVVEVDIESDTDAVYTHTQTYRHHGSQSGLNPVVLECKSATKDPSITSTLLNDPNNTPAWIAAPRATAAPGSTEVDGSTPVRVCINLRMLGNRVIWPTRATFVILRGGGAHLSLFFSSSLSDLCSGRTDSDLYPGKHRRGEIPDHQHHGPQVGTHLHHPGPFRRRPVRSLPALLRHQLRRGLLGMDAHPLHLYHPGGELRVPQKTRQRARGTDL